ncbi:MAG TPA: hypothetical protein VF546_05290 [Pyrinomonadaceae bacterium]|jgi:hypothetical protein
MMRRATGDRVWALAALAVALAVVSFSAAWAQQRRPSRRVTHPVRPRPVTQPQPTPLPPGAEPTLVSTADEQTEDTPRPARRAAPRATPSADQENARKLQQLSEEFTRLNERLDALQKERQADLLQERLTRAEQRSETLRTQLTQTLEKQADLQARAEQLDYDSRPESISLRAATMGTLSADALRTQLSAQIENEKRRVRAQLDVLDATRQRLEAAVATSDAEVDRLRTRLNEILDKSLTGDSTFALPAPTPSPTPPPPLP